MVTERWLPIPGWEGLYEVSDIGGVRSLDREISNGSGVFTHAGRVLHPYLDPSGYAIVNLSLPGKPRTRTAVHRLVLAAFVGPRPKGMHGRHLNGNPADNRLENLRYGTPSENAYDMVRHGRHTAARKTQCKNGHAFDQDNTFFSRAGHRTCRICRRERQQRYELRKALVLEPTK